MTPLDPGQYPPPGYPPKKKSSRLPIILGVVAVLLILGIGGAIKGFHAIQATSAEAITVGNAFVDDVGAHKYQQARLLFVPQALTSTSAGDMQDMEALIEKHHGAYIAHGKPEWFVQNYNGQTSVRLTYSAQFTKSPSPIIVVMMKTDQGWRVYDIHYDF